MTMGTSLAMLGITFVVLSVLLIYFTRPGGPTDKDE